MNFIFLGPRIIMGGIETLMSRMASWLIKKGHSVKILCKSIDDEMYGIFDDAGMIIVEDRIDKIHLLNKKCVKRILSKISTNPVDVIVSFSPGLLKSAVAIACSFKTKSRIVSGVWGDMWFSGYRKSPVCRFLYDPSDYIFHKLLSEHARLFANKTIKNSIEETCNCSIPGVIWPLPVDGNRFNSIKRKAERGEIVSVGRLSGMKEYNIGMIDIIKRLKDEGTKVRWFVYGDGRYKERMEDKIQELKLGDSIFLMGNIDYKEMYKVFETAWLFVGMGTAIVEASYAEVPSLSVVPFYTEPRTYGYFHDLPDFNVGEDLKTEPKDFFTELRNGLKVDNDEYERMCSESRKKAQLFNIDERMNDFMEHLGKVESENWDRKTTFGYRVSLFIYPVVRRLKKIVNLIASA